MRRETQHLILLLVGGAVLKISLNGTYARYVKPALGPWLTVTGAAAVLLAVALIARSFRKGPAERAAGGAHAHGHHHANRLGWLLMVPALALMFAPPPVLTVDQPPAQAEAALPVDPDLYPPLPPGQAEMKLMDLVGRAVNAPATIEGREVVLVGFIRHLLHGLYLARVFIWCCTADARAVVVRLDVTAFEAENGARRPEQLLTDKQWVRVVGTYVSGSVRDNPDEVPIVRVTDVAPIPEPQNPYET